MRPQSAQRRVPDKKTDGFVTRTAKEVSLMARACVSVKTRPQGAAPRCGSTRRPICINRRMIGVVMGASQDGCLMGNRCTGVQTRPRPRTRVNSVPTMVTGIHGNARLARNSGSIQVVCLVLRDHLTIPRMPVP
jgi:hypothetical protein